MKLLLAVDPGETNGIAIVQYDPFKLITLDQVPYSRLMDYLVDNLLQYEFSDLVIEDFRIRPGKQNGQRFVGSRMETIKAIGQIEMWAKTRGIPYVLQAAADGKHAQKWSRVIPPKNHAESHRYDAFNAGVFYLISRQKASLSELG